MLNIAAIFLAVAIVAGAVGFGGFAAVGAAEASKMLCYAFLMLFVLALGIDFFSRRPLA